MKKKTEIFILLLCVSSAIQTALSIKANQRSKALEETIINQGLKIQNLSNLEKIKAKKCHESDDIIEAKISRAVYFGLNR